MDSLSAFLDGPNARGAFLLRSILDPPWSLRIQDEAPLTVVAVLAGTACYVPDGAGTAPTTLGAGDVMIVRGPDPYTFADEPGRTPNIVIHPGGRCATPDGDDLHQAMGLGVRTWGTSTMGSTVMLTGTYLTDGEVSRRLLAALPREMTLRGETWECPVVALLAAEIVKERPGQQAVLDRLLDLLLVDALRTAFERTGAAVPSWLRAHDDPVIGRVVRMMHNDPARAWTVASLASAVGFSRASLARRFHDLVGEPPMTFLTGWRMALAADLLDAPGATVTSVARAVGYGSPFTFSTAFKRTFGVSPRGHRNRASASAGRAG